MMPGLNLSSSTEDLESKKDNGKLECLWLWREVVTFFDIQ